MPTYVFPKTGRTQEVQANETNRIAILIRLGWKQVEDEAATIPWEEAKATLRADGLLDAPAGVVTIEEELHPAKVGDAVLAVTEIPVKAVDPDSDDLSVDPDDAEAAHTEGVIGAEKPKRKGR